MFVEFADVLQNGDHDGALGAEQVVGRRQADLGPRGDGPHRKAGVAGLADQVARGGDDPPAALLLGLFASAHRIPWVDAPA